MTESLTKAIIATDRAAMERVLDGIDKACDIVLAEMSIGPIPSDYQEGRWDVAREMKSAIEALRAKIG